MHVREEDVERLKRFFATVTNQSKWTIQGCKVFVTESLACEKLLLSEGICEQIESLFEIRESMKRTPEFLLEFALEHRIHRKVLLELIQKFVEMVPNGRERASTVISSFIQKRSQIDLITEKTPPEFIPFVISSLLTNNSLCDDVQVEHLGAAVAKAIAKRPDLIDEKMKKLIAQRFEDIPVEDLVQAAVSSRDGMKCILSILVPLIVDRKSIKAREIFQRIAADGRGEPARLVASSIESKFHIEVIP